MDHKQEQFMRMQQYQYAPKMPFYMSYPIQNIYMTEMEYERDMERMKELYPEEAKQIQKLVEDECDKMEYEGSMMFDEYPDRIMLKVICDRIYQNALQQAGPQDMAGQRQDETEMARASQLSDASDVADVGSDPTIPTTSATLSTIEEVQQQNFRPGPPGRPPGPPGRPPGPPGWRPGPPPGRPPHDQGLGTLIEVLLYNEMYKRRCRHNRCRRWW